MAVWRGDIETVKRLTLRHGKDTNGERCSPLNIAVQDSHSNSPFSIAPSLERYDLAWKIYHIAEAQYKPLTALIYDSDRESSDEESSNGESSDYDNMSDEAAELAEARFDKLAALLQEDDISINDIRKVKGSVGSPIPPALMFDWPCPRSVQRWKSAGAFPRSARRGISPRNVTAMAVYQNDLDMLSCILDLAEMPGKNVIGEDRKPIKRGNSFALNDHVFRVALQSASPTTLAELIKRTAAGFPLDELAKESGVNLPVQQDLGYQGLKGYKTKLQEQAREEKPIKIKSKYITPPLLQAAYLGPLQNLNGC